METVKSYLATMVPLQLFATFKILFHAKKKRQMNSQSSEIKAEMFENKSFASKLCVFFIYFCLFSSFLWIGAHFYSDQLEQKNSINVFFMI